MKEFIKVRIEDQAEPKFWNRDVEEKDYFEFREPELITKTEYITKAVIRRCLPTKPKGFILIEIHFVIVISTKTGNMPFTPENREAITAVTDAFMEMDKRFIDFLNEKGKSSAVFVPAKRQFFENKAASILQANKN